MSARLSARERDYNLGFVESVEWSLARLHREGALAPESYDLNHAAPEAREKVARDLARNVPWARAFGDEAADQARAALQDWPITQQAIIAATQLLVSGRLVVGRSFGEDGGGKVRLRGIIDRDSNRIEARYAQPTSIGNLEVATSLRRGIDRPGHTAGVSLRQPCKPEALSCTSVNLGSETVDDAARTRITALSGRRIYKSGWILTGGVERVQTTQSTIDRVTIGAIFASF